MVLFQVQDKIMPCLSTKSKSWFTIHTYCISLKASWMFWLLFSCFYVVELPTAQCLLHIKVHVPLLSSAELTSAHCPQDCMSLRANQPNAKVVIQIYRCPLPTVVLRFSNIHWLWNNQVTSTFPFQLARYLICKLGLKQNFIFSMLAPHFGSCSFAFLSWATTCPLPTRLLVFKSKPT